IHEFAANSVPANPQDLFPDYIQFNAAVTCAPLFAVIRRNWTVRAKALCSNSFRPYALAYQHSLYGLLTGHGKHLVGRARTGVIGMPNNLYLSVGVRFQDLSQIAHGFVRIRRELRRATFKVQVVKDKRARYVRGGVVSKVAGEIVVDRTWRDGDCYAARET